MGGLDDLTNMAGQGGGLQETISDTGIEKAGDAVDDRIPGDQAGIIDKGENIADQKIGE
jgi:hypothetical protein